MKRLPDHIRKANKAASKKRHYLANRDKYLKMECDRSQLRRYGVTPEIYDSLLAQQDGKCGICKKDRSGKKGQRFAVDHDHVTGEIRGLLCIKCNSCLGWFEPYGHMAITYLACSHRKLRVAK